MTRMPFQAPLTDLHREIERFLGDWNQLLALSNGPQPPN